MRIRCRIAVAGYDPLDTSGNSYSYPPFDIVDVPDHIARDLIDNGLADLVESEPETATVKPKAETRKK